MVRRTEIGIIYSTGLAQGLSLVTFPAASTIGRVVVTFVSIWVSDRWIYRTLPILILLALIGIPRINVAVESIIAYGFAGLACSAFLLLSVSFTQEEFSRIVEVVSGGVMAGIC